MTGRLNYRVAGVAIQDSQVLLHRKDDDVFWALPGGRVEWGEEAQAALRREMREETGAEIDIERLGWFAETFFEHGGQRHHEISLYFVIRILTPIGTSEPGLQFQWVPLDSLQALPLQPAFLREGLTNLPTSINHIVQKD